MPRKVASKAESIATQLDQVWGNFRPEKPIAPDSPFWINRTDFGRYNNTVNDLARLAKEDNEGLEKRFLIGHRGAGKSSYLKALLISEKVKALYHPIQYSIADVVAMNDLDYRELMLSIAARLINEGLKLDAIGPKLKKELESWSRQLTEEISKEQGAELSVEAGAKVNFLTAMFASFQGKLKTQNITRQSYRKVIEPKIGDLVNIISDVAQAIYNKENRLPLVAVDDLDKALTAPWGKAEELFNKYIDVLKSPRCHIIYTVPVLLMHDSTWSNIRVANWLDWYVPNIKLHEPDAPNKPDLEGRELMKSFVLKRMEQRLISDEALEALITYSGGVMRQACHLVQSAVDWAIDREEKAKRLELSDIAKAVAEESSGLVPLIGPDDLEVLKAVAKNNFYTLPFNKMRLLFDLILLRYPNGVEPWHTLNPVLSQWLERRANT